MRASRLVGFKDDLSFAVSVEVHPRVLFIKDDAESGRAEHDLARAVVDRRGAIPTVRFCCIARRTE
jgi:hypothetical protein